MHTTSHTSHPLVIAIDGPSASGKGTLAELVAKRLSWHLLDSGALYRVLALAAKHRDMSITEPAQYEALGNLAQMLNVSFLGHSIMLDGEVVDLQLRSEEISRAASVIAVIPAVREGLLARQHAFRKAPGLVADGRDMGSVVFPDAFLKIYLTASVEVRAQRRYKQLSQKGIPATIASLARDLRERDARDTSRPIAPLVQCKDALLLDTTDMTIENAVEFVLQHAHARMR